MDQMGRKARPDMLWTLTPGGVTWSSLRVNASDAAQDPGRLS
ncbi:hypothetical protein PXH59_18965 [Xenorhabdus sp. SF857]|nr:hypothetical protein [Xenorhabdus sp. SF857]WFQ79599.1 hypothetical protein PXH59_18965 [Xenorhabdus sp. SF857]